MSLWFRIIGILSVIIAVYFYYNDDHTMALIFGVLGSMGLSLSWIFNAVR
jgi:hypothetical protein